MPATMSVNFKTTLAKTLWKSPLKTKFRPENKFKTSYWIPKYDFVKNLKALSVRFMFFVILLERGLDAGFKL